VLYRASCASKSHVPDQEGSAEKLRKKDSMEKMNDVKKDQKIQSSNRDSVSQKHGAMEWHLQG